MTSLKKIQIIKELGKNYSISIKNVHQLNLILEEMGILKHFANGWATTDKGLKFSIYISKGLNDDLWKECIVKEIMEYLTKK